MIHRQIAGRRAAHGQSALSVLRRQIAEGVIRQHCGLAILGEADAGAFAVISIVVSGATRPAGRRAART